MIHKTNELNEWINILIVDYKCNVEDSDDVNCILEQDQISDNTDWIRRSVCLSIITSLEEFNE